MFANVDGQRWRLKFTHFNYNKASRKSKVNGMTACVVEKWDNSPVNGSGKVVGWVVISQGLTKCGPKDKYTREQGRQFSMIRALQSDSLTNKVKASLIQAYLNSSKHGRSICIDLYDRGYDTFFDAVFRPNAYKGIYIDSDSFTDPSEPIGENYLD